LGGAHAEPEDMAERVKQYIIEKLGELSLVDAETRIQQRIDKFSKMGFYDEV